MTTIAANYSSRGLRLMRARMKNRRELLSALGASALLVPFSSFAQQQPGRIPRVGYLSPITESSDASRNEAFRRGLSELGYAPGKSIMIETRFADGKVDRLPGLAAELVRLKVDIIVAAGGGQIALAARSATNTIPIVMTNVEDPVSSGLVTSLARPGGNVTGLSTMLFELGAKRVELIRDTVAGVSTIAVLWNASYPEKLVEIEQSRAAAKALGLRLLSVEVRDAEEIDRKLLAIPASPTAALIVLPDPLVNVNEQRILAFAQKRRMPAMYTQRNWVDAGGMMSYGPNYLDLYQRAAAYVDKILKGAKPADLPVEQPTAFELIVNLKTANSLGIKIPHSILVRATRVIE